MNDFFNTKNIKKILSIACFKAAVFSVVVNKILDLRQLNNKCVVFSLYFLNFVDLVNPT